VKTRIASTAPGTVLALALAGCGGGGTGGGVVSLPEVSFTATAETVAEDGKPVITVELSRAPTEDITLNYTVGGTATGGEDFIALSGTVTVRAGEARVIVPIEITDDTETDPGETLVLTLAAGTGYTLADEDIAFTITIQDNDPRTVSTGGSTGGGGSSQPAIESQQASDPNVSGMNGDQGGGTLIARVLAALGENGNVNELSFNPADDPESKHYIQGAKHFGVSLGQSALTIWSAPPNGYGRVSVNDSAFTGTATYSGTVIGYAYHWPPDSQTGGGFNANIQLNANFDDESLDGTVSNFSGPGANPTWGDVNLENGGVIGGAVAGDWSHEFYRKENEGNPNGVTGTVNLEFSDGRARGAYNAD